MKILVAVDGSPFTKRMLGYLAAHDEWLGAQNTFTVLTVVPAVLPRAAAVLAKDVLKAHYEEESEKVLKPIRRFLAKKGLPVEFVSKTGAAAEVIAALADNGRYDLLMMGSHGHGSLRNLVLGSVATKVMAHCSTPVLLVR
jgi:nucleotide-binding universal stress UspA family protein